MKEIEEEISRLADEIVKQNRDRLDEMYNLDEDNLGESLRRLFAEYSDGISSAKASISALADSTGAKFEALAKWQTETSSSLSQISGKADANAASIALLNQFKTETVSSISAIESKADANSASITNLVRWQGQADGDIDTLIDNYAAISAEVDDASSRISLLVNASGDGLKSSAAGIIVEAINDSPSTVTISADKVDISGFVTFSDLETDGEATVNGNNISLISSSTGNSKSQLNFWLGNHKDEGDDYLLGSMYTESSGFGSGDYTFAINSGHSSRQFVDLSIVSSADAKLEAVQNIHIEAGMGDMSLLADGSIRADAGYITLLPLQSYSSSREVPYAWQFFDDGIYYNGYCMVSTPS